jgi:hypothetical protein
VPPNTIQSTDQACPGTYGSIWSTITGAVWGNSQVTCSRQMKRQAYLKPWNSQARTTAGACV